MATLAGDTRVREGRPPTAPPARPLDIALLGLGRIGSAVARRIASGAGHHRARIAAALVRDPARRREAPLPDGATITNDPDALFARQPDVVVELLGGVEPAFTLVARALALGIPVVTANKSLLAARGRALESLAADRGVPLLYEASVLAGVPFLGALARRPHAASLSRIAGILNGTSNFVLGRMDSGASFDGALADAQRLGLAEPQPDNDVQGLDAAEKLAILIRHFGWGHIAPGRIDTSGIDGLDPAVLAAARACGGIIKPVVLGERSGTRVTAFAGPAFLPGAHRLARVTGADNALVLSAPYGDLVYAGPGAGPDATAATVLDDVGEAVTGRNRPAHEEPRPLLDVGEPDTAWFVWLTADDGVPSGEEGAARLGAHGIWLRHTSLGAGTGAGGCALLTCRVPKARLDAALAALRAATGCTSAALRVLED